MFKWRERQGPVNKALMEHPDRYGLPSISPILFSEFMERLFPEINVATLCHMTSTLTDGRLVGTTMARLTA